MHTPSEPVPKPSTDAREAPGSADLHRQLLPSEIDELLSAERRKDEFLATLCHELRSPLGAIQNALAYLDGQAGQDRAVQQRLHALIGRQVRHMTRLTADLLDISRVSRGKLSLQRHRIDLGVVLRQVIESMHFDIQQRRQRLTISLPEAPVWLQADATRLYQVFHNLLANAAKYTDLDGDLTLSLRLHDHTAVVSIRDSGIGIPAETLPHIFDLFVQGNPSAHRPGLGIGLALVRTLVELHGGSVTGTSAGVGQGSEFSVQLPFEP